jgi:hypothetical protein
VIRCATKRRCRLSAASNTYGVNAPADITALKGGRSSDGVKSWKPQVGEYRRRDGRD